MLKDALPNEVLQWVLAVLDPHATFQSSRRLYGGVSTTLHSISIRVGQLKQNVVLRQFDNAQWLQEEPDLALHEANSLRWAMQTGLPTPQLIAFDQTGPSVPLLLMSQLPGEVVLTPPDMALWLTGLAASLAKIHQVEAADYAWKYFTYQKLRALEVPTWSSYKPQWAKLIKLVNKLPIPSSRHCFIHRDYHRLTFYGRLIRLAAL